MSRIHGTYKILVLLWDVFCFLAVTFVLVLGLLKIVAGEIVLIEVSF